MQRKLVAGHRAKALEVDPETSVRLGRVRRLNTRPEQVFRYMLREVGLHYRIQNKDLPGSPDVANRTYRWAVFVNGCFWHHHRGCNKATVPKRNTDFWLRKFADNRSRDARVIRKLRLMGYRTLIVWECRLNAEPDLVSRRIRARLVGRVTHKSLRKKSSHVHRSSD